MNDFKSKLPDFKELSSMTSKLFKDMTKSISEIIITYKENRATQQAEKKDKPVEEASNKEVKADSKESENDIKK